MRGPQLTIIIGARRSGRTTRMRQTIAALQLPANETLELRFGQVWERELLPQVNAVPHVLAVGIDDGDNSLDLVATTDALIARGCDVVVTSCPAYGRWPPALLAHHAPVVVMLPRDGA